MFQSSNLDADIKGGYSQKLPASNNKYQVKFIYEDEKLSSNCTTIAFVLEQ